MREYFNPMEYNYFMGRSGVTIFGGRQSGVLCRVVRALLFFGCLLSLPVQARPLKIETIESAPFGYIDDQGKPAGIMYEIGNRIAEEAGMEYVNSIVPYARTSCRTGAGRV